MKVFIAAKMRVTYCITKAAQRHGSNPVQHSGGRIYTSLANKSKPDIETLIVGKVIV